MVRATFRRLMLRTKTKSCPMMTRMRVEINPQETFQILISTKAKIKLMKLQPSKKVAILLRGTAKKLTQ